MNKYQALYEAKQYGSFRQLLDDVVKKYPENNAFIVKKNKAKKEYDYVTYKRFYDEVNYMGERKPLRMDGNTFCGFNGSRS